MPDDEDLRADAELITSVLTLEMRIARLEGTVAKLMTRLDPTTSYAHALEVLRK